MMVEGQIEAANLEAALKSLIGQIDSVLTEGLMEVGEDMAGEMNRNDRLNVAHDTIIVQKRKGAVAVGPSKAGGRAHITRFHEFGTAHHAATPLIRPVADKAGANIRKKLTKRLKQAIQIAKR